MTQPSCFVSGSIAYDNILEYPKLFSETILSEQIHKLNVAFLVPKMQKHFGGCAGNIAYGLNLLNINANVIASIGSDGDEYLKYLEQRKINTKYIKKLDNYFTAQATIVTDASQNQITCFHPGAMSIAHENIIPKLNEQISLAIVAPDATKAMIAHVERLHELKISCIFDPGQMLPTFTQKELAEILSKIDYIILNAYESEILAQMMSTAVENLFKNLKAAIITDAEHGAKVFTNQEKYLVPSVKAESILDPTGCGDAFRAGFIYGLLNNYDLKRCIELGHVMGAKKIATQGGQNYTIDVNILENGYKELV